MNITVETLRLIYNIGSEKKQSLKVSSVPSKPSANSGFFSSLFASFTGSGQSPTPTIPQPLPEPIKEIDSMAGVTSHVTLTVFSGEVNVSLTQKMITELHRSTKKNPPSRLKLDLIYVSDIYIFFNELSQHLM